MKVKASERLDMMLRDDIDNEDLKLIDLEIARFSQNFQQKESLAQTIKDLLSK